MFVKILIEKILVNIFAHFSFFFERMNVIEKGQKLSDRTIIIRRSILLNMKTFFIYKLYSVKKYLH